MNQYLKSIQELIQQNNRLSEQDKEALIKAIADADKKWSITEFKLDRTEKVKKTTAILLEETIEELEQKRQAVEVQNRELEIEAALERTRTQSMLMQHSKELDDTLRVFHEQVLLLGINSAFSFLWLPDEDKNRHIFWAACAENISSEQVVKIVQQFSGVRILIIRSTGVILPSQCLIDWKSNEPVYSYFLPPAEVENYFAVWQELIDGVETLQPQHFRDGLYYVEAFMKYGCFGVMVRSKLTEDEKKRLDRFAIEFERAYTVSSISKKQKRRQEKHRLKLHWKKFAAVPWLCTRVRSYWMPEHYYTVSFQSWGSKNLLPVICLLLKMKKWDGIMA